MIKLFCDKCGEEIENKYGYDTIFPNLKIEDERFLLCKNCIEKIKMQLKNKQAR